MKIIKRDKIKFGLVVTLKEINGENRIDEFIQRCFFNQWFVEKGDIINKHYNECYLITKNIDISDVYKTNNILYLVTTLSYLVAVVLNLIGGF
mgnify:CR=1 FL=1